jgi:biotin transport system permease protein
MLAYESGNSFVHQLDPRSKLAVQIAFAAAAFAHTDPRGLAILSVLAVVILVNAGLSPFAVLVKFRFFLPFLLAAPVFAGIVWGPPWFSLTATIQPALSSYRVLLVLFVSASYIRTTPVRDSRAAIERLVPGRIGRLLAIGVALCFRFLPVLQSDLSRTREAMRARLGDERSLIDRIRIVAVAGLRRAFTRADRLELALRARCFAWNPTLPLLTLTWRDLPALALAVGLFVWAI